jgi:hypothetical protein
MDGLAVRPPIAPCRGDGSRLPEASTDSAGAHKGRPYSANP